jgi:hypothetical protein
VVTVGNVQVPAFPSEDDPRFREMLARALAVPGDPQPEQPIDIEACKRQLHEAQEWVRQNRDKWSGPKSVAAVLLGPLPAAPRLASDPSIDLEKIKRELREAQEWVSQNREKWFGPAAAVPTASAEAPAAAAPKKARGTVIRTPPARARSTLTARRHRGVRRRPQHRARLLSRAGPDDGPAPRDPDAHATNLKRAMLARPPFVGAALHGQAHDEGDLHRSLRDAGAGVERAAATPAPRSFTRAVALPHGARGHEPALQARPVAALPTSGPARAACRFPTTIETEHRVDGDALMRAGATAARAQDRRNHGTTGRAPTACLTRRRLARSFGGRAVMWSLDQGVEWPRCGGWIRVLTIRDGANGAEGLSHGSS